MFWNNKKAEQITKLEEKMETEIEALKQGISAGNARLSDMDRNLQQLQNSVREQGISVEDLLEEWSERKSVEDGLRKQLHESVENEGHLLELFEAYQEQFRNLKRFAESKDTVWSEQVAMMEKGLEHYRQLCGISVIDKCGAEVNYDLHEVIKVIDTGRADQDGKIADVYRCGYLYQGRVRRKAKVAVYTFKRSEDGGAGGL